MGYLKIYQDDVTCDMQLKVEAIFRLNLMLPVYTDDYRQILMLDIWCWETGSKNSPIVRKDTLGRNL